MTSGEEVTPVRTGGGDNGQSSLIDGVRLFKDSGDFHALGGVDEAQACLGVCRSMCDPASPSSIRVELADDIEWIQQRLLDCGGLLSDPAGTHEALDALRNAFPARVDEIQSRFDHWRSRAGLEPRFYISGATRLGAELDRARTVVRRAERWVVKIVQTRGTEPLKDVSRFLNVLSDFLFVLARWVDEDAA